MREFVQVRPRAVVELCEEHGIVGTDRHVLRELIDVVDYVTDTYVGTLTQMAREMSVHQRTLKRSLERLEAAGVVACDFAQGRSGTVRLLVYERLVKLSDRAVARRAKAAAEAAEKGTPARSEKGTPARSEKALCAEEKALCTETPGETPDPSASEKVCPSARDRSVGTRVPPRRSSEPELDRVALTPCHDCGEDYPLLDERDPFRFCPKCASRRSLR